MRTLLPFALLFTTPALSQLENGDFETTIETPEGWLAIEHWATVSIFGGGPMDQAHSGNHALGVWNWYWYAEGLASNGISIINGQDGTPVSGFPTQLSGWYKRDLGYIQAGEYNQAVVNVLLTRWNAATLQRDTIATGTRLFDQQLDWAPFTVDIGYTSVEAPDTVVVQLRSCGDCMCDTYADGGTCAYFTVDDLALSFAQGLTEAMTNEQAVRLIHQDRGTLRVHVQPDTPLPLRLQLWDPNGRTAADVLVQRDGQLVTLPGSSGLFAYRASADGRSVSAGRVVVR